MRGALTIASTLGLGACQIVLGIEGYPATLGAPCSINQVCATGEVCDFSAPSGPVCVVDGGDSDSDGIPDAQDHCLHVAGGAHDEDGDGAGNECDRCPIAPPPAQPDPDNDGVDSPCDPNRNLSGERIAFFDAFDGDRIGTSWRPATPALWQVSGGALHYNGLASGPEELIEVSFEMATNVAVQTSYRVTRVETSGARHRVSIGAQDPAPLAGIARFVCAAERIDTYPDKVVVETSFGLDQMAPPTGVDVFSTERIHRIAGVREGATASCVFLDGTLPGGTTQAPIGAGQLGNAWLGGQATSIEFDWILVVVR